MPSRPSSLTDRIANRLKSRDLPHMNIRKPVGRNFARFVATETYLEGRRSPFGVLADSIALAWSVGGVNRQSLPYELAQALGVSLIELHIGSVLTGLENPRCPCNYMVHRMDSGAACNFSPKGVTLS